MAPITGAGPGSSSDSGVEKVISSITESLKKSPFDPLFHARPCSLLSNAESDRGATAAGEGAHILSSLSIMPSTPDVSVRVPEVRMPSFTSLAAQMEQLASEYLTAISVGVALGAAVATGIGLGCVAASGLVSGARVLPSFWYGLSRTRRWVVGFWAEKIPSAELDDTQTVVYKNENEEREDVNSDLSGRNQVAASALDNASSRERGQSSGEAMEPTRGAQDAKISFLGSGENKIFVVRGDIRSHGIISTSSAEQCRECLDDVSVQLGKNLLGWQHVRKLTAYLVGGVCNAETFRTVLKQYPLSAGTAVMSVVFVQRLERDHASVQVEVLASV